MCGTYRTAKQTIGARIPCRIQCFCNGKDICIQQCFGYCVFFSVRLDAAGNFIVPLSSLSYNAYKTVIDIDTMGTFNCSKAVYDKWFKVSSVTFNW